jgi:hypothetical protein
MKILFTRGLYHGHTEGRERKPKQFQQDYLADTVLHGFKTLFGQDVIDAPRIWSLYKSEFITNHSTMECYGRGFTTSNLLSDEYDNVDRTDIEQKIKAKYFDLIVFSCVDLNTPYRQLVLDTYPRNQIISLDGHDIIQCQQDLVYKTIYFKRELPWKYENLFPISFSFPKEKIQPRIEKEKLLSHIIPGGSEKHIYTVEKEYYDEYGKSIFGITHKKAGWDCMRHYEIMANHCIPLFLDIEQCPQYTCATLPKQELKCVLDLYNTDKNIDWKEKEESIFDHFINNCTTEHTANYILDIWKNCYK